MTSTTGGRFSPSSGKPRTGSGTGTEPLPSAPAVGLARAEIEVRQFFRRRDSVVFTFSFPVILLFIFGSVFTQDVVPGISFTQYFTAGMIAAGILLSSFQSLAIGIAIERDDGTLKRLRGTPMPPLSYFLGKVGLVLVTSVVQSAILLLVGALFFDLKLPTDPSVWLRFVWIFVLGTAAGTVMGIAYSSVARSSASAAAVVSPVVIVLEFVSGVFLVFTDLPGWMRGLGSVFPLKWLAQGMRSVFLPGSFAQSEAAHSWQLPQTALILAAWTLAGLFLCLRTFRWQRHDAG